ncbi:MAG: aldolase/citrate lyase family protein [Acidobacteria bacterium]|nr:aldolase/citrate lyase family protein [Acidobacteriota bacterium]
MSRRVLLLTLLLTSLAHSQQLPAGFVNPVKKTLQEGGVVIGATVQASNLDTMSILANAGFDFLWIEGEHSPITLETTHNMILATQGRRAVPFTRVPVNELWTAKRMLDIGSLGVIFPFTDTPALARQAVDACKYPPAGRRGFGPGMASMRWPAQGGYPKWANDNVMVIVIIERPAAVEQVEEIAAVPGIDVLFIGLNDLSYGYGVPGQLQAPVMKAAVARVMAAGRKHGIPVGGPGGGADIKRMISEGYRFIQGPSDLSLLQSATREFFNGIKAAGVEKKDPVPLY